MPIYALYGVLPTEHERNPEPLTLEQQVDKYGETLIYETDDQNEAQTIYQEGGFVRCGQWHVVTRYEVMGEGVPQQGSPVSKAPASLPKTRPISKEDFR